MGNENLLARLRKSSSVKRSAFRGRTSAAISRYAKIVDETFERNIKRNTALAEKRRVREAGIRQKFKEFGQASSSVLSQNTLDRLWKMVDIEAPTLLGLQVGYESARADDFNRREKLLERDRDSILREQVTDEKVNSELGRIDRESLASQRQLMSDQNSLDSTLYQQSVADDRDERRQVVQQQRDADQKVYELQRFDRQEKANAERDKRRDQQVLANRKEDRKYDAAKDAARIAAGLEEERLKLDADLKDAQAKREFNRVEDIRRKQEKLAEETRKNKEARDFYKFQQDNKKPTGASSKFSTSDFVLPRSESVVEERQVVEPPEPEQVIRPGDRGATGLSGAEGLPSANQTGMTRPMSEVIASGESEGYGSINRGTAGDTAEQIDLENMTVSEVMAAQGAGQFSAAGRYQIMPETLVETANALGLTGSEKFDPAMQDKMFSNYLVKTKRKPLMDYVSGQSNDKNAALLSASQEFAAIPDPNTGRSYYDGLAGNKSNIDAGEFAKSVDHARSEFQRLTNEGMTADEAYSRAVGVQPLSQVEMPENNYTEIINQFEEEDKTEAIRLAALSKMSVKPDIENPTLDELSEFADSLEEDDEAKEYLAAAKYYRNSLA